MKTILLTIVLLTLNSCSSQKVNKNLPYPIQEVYFQNWVGGQELTGSGTDLHVTFKSNLPENVKLIKCYFQDKEINFQKMTDKSYIAKIYMRPNNPDYILDENPTKEYGNKAPVIKKSKYKLNLNEAVLQFLVNNKIQLYKIVNIKEKELLAYPSAKPRN
jgi:hypothetical protein